MPQFELRFQIPDRRLGEPACAFTRVVDRCMQIQGKSMGNAKVTEVHVTGGSLFGSVSIDANSYESALSLVCRETPIIQLEWHLEEEVSPQRTGRSRGNQAGEVGHQPSGLEALSSARK